MAETSYDVRPNRVPTQMREWQPYLVIYDGAHGYAAFKERPRWRQRWPFTLPRWRQITDWCDSEWRAWYELSFDLVPLMASQRVDWHGVGYAKRMAVLLMPDTEMHDPFLSACESQPAWVHQVYHVTPNWLRRASSVQI